MISVGRIRENSDIRRIKGKNKKADCDDKYTYLQPMQAGICFTGQRQSVNRNECKNYADDKSGNVKENIILSQNTGVSVKKHRDKKGAK